MVFVGYILESHFGGSESANCDQTTRQNVDIHLALVTQKPSTLSLTNLDTECASVTAEIISHHRPTDWELLGRMTGTPAAQKLTKAQQRLADEDLQRPLRFKGQLLFDASHELCTSGGYRTTGNPPRVDNESRWTPLDRFLAVPSDSD